MTHHFLCLKELLLTKKYLNICIFKNKDLTLQWIKPFYTNYKLKF